MYESAAINTYLGDKFRGGGQEGEGGCPELVPPPGTAARGRYEQTTMCIMTELDAQGLWIHRKHESLARYFGAIPEAVSHAKSHSLRTVGVLATQLRQSGGPYLLGADFSAADILLVHCIDWAEAIGWGEAWTGDAGAQAGADAENMQALTDYLGRCRARDAYVRAVAKKNAESAETM